MSELVDQRTEFSFCVGGKTHLFSSSFLFYLQYLLPICWRPSFPYSTFQMSRSPLSVDGPQYQTTQHKTSCYSSIQLKLECVSCRPQNGSLWPVRWILQLQDSQCIVSWCGQSQLNVQWMFLRGWRTNDHVLAVELSYQHKRSSEKCTLTREWNSHPSCSRPTNSVLQSQYITLTECS